VQVTDIADFHAPQVRTEHGMHDSKHVSARSPSPRARLSRPITGLDHAGFMVPVRNDLEAWQAHLESKGVTTADVADKPLTQSPIADEPYASVLVYRDPDNIQLELFAPLR
jgi:catechol 2,3-dioxygenase-like lactoylglutathione lyase family enzyme